MAKKIKFDKNNPKTYFYFKIFFLSYRKSLKKEISWLKVIESRL